MNYQKSFNNELQQGAEGNIAMKTIAAIVAAGAITALSLAVSYSAVTAFQPSSDSSYTAAACGDKDGDDPKVLENTCGEDKEDGGGKTIDA